MRKNGGISAEDAAGNVRKKKRGIKNVSLLLIMLPTVAYIVIFHYLPMGGLIIAFKDYNSFEGMFGSPWAGDPLKHFKNFVTLPSFWPIIRNTLVLSVYSIAVYTVLPIVLALFINEVKPKGYKKTIQTISYAPYFISTVVAVGMLFTFSNQESGIFNTVKAFFGGERTNVMESKGWFSTIYVMSGLWQGWGWWAIIYVGTLSTVDPNLHEAAVLDGAGRLRRIWSINIPAIVPMALIMLILAIGNMLNLGFEKIFLMQTDPTIPVSEVLSTYVYRVTFMTTKAQYSYAAAIGLFNSVVSMVLLIGANFASKLFGGTSLW
ncbi:MAG: ABC transporter permease subunit [Clostridiales bacterium]|jgi:putative aldouronate transport system permease protein|nr:ABC transporter permease subunit [Clostridiales bacterium]